MKEKRKKIFIHYAKKIFGIILVIIGAIGLFLPFLQGIVMILLGVALLSGKPAIKGIKRLSNKLQTHWNNIWH